MVDLTKMNLDATDIVKFSMQGEETFEPSILRRAGNRRFNSPFARRK